MNLIHRWLCRSPMWRSALERKLLPWALERAELGRDLLEVGPGPGLTTDLLRKRVAHLTAIEIDPCLARPLKRRMEHTNVTVVEGDATAMPFEDRTFSAAVSLTMLHHVPSASLQDRLLAEVYRVLRPGGVFIGMDNTPSLAFSLIHISDTLVTVDPQTLGSRLECAGFGGIEIRMGRGRFCFRAIRPN